MTGDDPRHTRFGKYSKSPFCVFSPSGRRAKPSFCIKASGAYNQTLTPQVPHKYPTSTPQVPHKYPTSTLPVTDVEEEEVLRPDELLKQYHAQRTALDAKIDQTLSEIQKILGVTID